MKYNLIHKEMYMMTVKIKRTYNFEFFLIKSYSIILKYIKNNKYDKSNR